MELLAFTALSTVIPTLIVAVSLVLSAKDRSLPNIILAGMLIVITILTICTVILGDFQYQSYFPYAHMLNLTILLLGPLLYLYISSSLRKNIKVSWKQGLLFLPFSCVFIYYLREFLGYRVFIAFYADQNMYKMIEIMYNLFYLLFVPVFVHREGISYKDFFFNFRNRQLFWLRFLYISVAIIFITKAVAVVLLDVVFYPRQYMSVVSLYFAFVGIFFGITIYVVLNRERFFFSRKRSTGLLLPKEDIDEKYCRISCSMDENRLYLDPDLTLKKMEAKTGVPGRLISIII